MNNITPIYQPAQVMIGSVAHGTTDKILINTMTGMHRCADCDYMSQSFASVRAHRNTHSTKTRKPRSDAKTAAPSLRDRFNEIFEKLSDLESDVLEAATPATPVVNVEKLNEYKARALAAEKSLSKFKKLFREVAA